MMLKRNDSGPMVRTWVLLIIIGVPITFWLSTLPHDVLNTINAAGLFIFMLLLAQPGLFLTFTIATKDKWTWKKRAAIGAPTFLLMVLAIPTTITKLLWPYIYLTGK